MTGVIILAAGGSTRLGQAKQLLVLGERSLVQIAADTAIESGCGPIVVVTGSYAAEVEHELKNRKVSIVRNDTWQQGMSSSIIAGIQYLLVVEPQLENIILMLADQPFAEASLLKSLTQKARDDNKGIVASYYNNTVGVPALFNKKYFNELLSLTGQEGAKKVITHHLNDVETVPFILGHIDIDTIDDYNKLIDKEQKYWC